MNGARGKRRAARPEPAAPAPERVFRAGCGRAWRERSLEADLAYTALEFPECAACPHRVEPDDGPNFCRLVPEGSPHPFADLATLEWPDDAAP